MATTDVPWELYSSDLKLSRMVIKRELPSVQFEISILPQPPKYKPGDGPPPPRIDLRLVHDTSAYIIDKIVLPLEPFTQRNDPRQRRVYYIIAWPDLPAARPIIDATKILDYVSPRALEDWEYQDALRREDAREAEERANKKGKAVVATGAAGAAAGPKAGKKRKPGRPPRARMMDAPPPEPVLDSDQEEMLQRRKSVPSLSTPQKTRLAQLVAEVEMLENLEEVEEDDDPVSVIQRQLKADDFSGDDIDLDADDNLEEPNYFAMRQSSSVASGTSGRETSRASNSRPYSAEKPPTNPATSLARAAAATAAAIRDPPLTPSIRQNVESSSPSSSRTQNKPVRPISYTSVPLPPYVSQLKKRQSSTSKPEPPTKAQSEFVMPSVETRAPAGHGQDARPVSKGPEAYAFMGQRPSSSSKLSPLRGNGFTPIGGTFTRPPKRPADNTPPASDTSISTQIKKVRKKQTQPPRPHSENGVEDEAQGAAKPAIDLEQSEQDYVVKRLEGDYMLDGVHWFKVRWEGDWPPDQNPTWEPKANISAKLVKEYLMKKAKREAEKSSKNNTPTARDGGAGKPKDKRQSSLAEWAKRYNSVSEAFEGKAELDASTDAILGRRRNGQAGEQEDEDRDGHDGHDELFVVEQDNDQERERAGKEWKKRVDAELAAQFASMARGRSRPF